MAHTILPPSPQSGPKPERKTRSGLEDTGLGTWAPGTGSLTSAEHSIGKAPEIRTPRKQQRLPVRRPGLTAIAAPGPGPLCGAAGGQADGRLAWRLPSPALLGPPPPWLL